MAKVFSQSNISVEQFLRSLVSLQELTDAIINTYHPSTDHQNCDKYEAFQDIYREACTHLQKSFSELYQTAPKIILLDPQGLDPRWLGDFRPDSCKLEVPLVYGPDSLNLKEMCAHDQEADRLENYLSTRYFSLGLRRFAIGFVAAGPELCLCYFDHTMCIKTEPFHVFEKQGLFLRVVATISHLCNEDLGRENCLVVTNPDPSLFLKLPSGSTHDQHGDLIQSDIELPLQLPLSSVHSFQHRGPIFGRGAVCVSVSAPVEDTTHEWLALIAWYKAEKNNGLRVIHDSDRCDKRCYPEVMHAFTETVKLPGQSMDKQKARNARELHILVYRIPRKFRDLAYIKSHWVFKSVFVDLVRRHWEAYGIGVLYKGINAQGLGFYPDGDKFIAFLSDWSQSGKENSARKGASPYWAIELLNDPPPRHKYRHDLESFFWLLLWFIGQKQDVDNFFDKTLDFTYGDMQKWKLGFLNNSSMREILINKLNSEFLCVVDDWILPLAELLKEAHKSFDMDVPGQKRRDKLITYDNFMEILEGRSASARSG